jgi:hypothetical protein
VSHVTSDVSLVTDVVVDVCESLIAMPRKRRIDKQCRTHWNLAWL